MRNILSASITGIFLWAFSLLADDSIFAQQLEQKAVTINTDLVTTWAQVTNRVDGAPLKGLGLDDFQLREDGKRQQVGLVKEGQPLSVVILVDGMTCVSEPERWYQHREEMLRQLGDDAEIALMAWDSDVVLVQPLTKNQRIVADKLNDKLNFFYALNPGDYGINPISGSKEIVRPERTRYRPGEAVYQAAKYLDEVASPDRRKIIIVISYAEIRMADKYLHSGEQVKLLLQKTGTTVNVLYHHTPDEYKDLRSPVANIANATVTVPYGPAILVNNLKRRSGGTLNQFVEQTGGTTLTGKWEECDEMFIKLAQMIRSSYTIGYYPENTNFDGKFRRIKLELSPSGKAKAGKVNITARDGYHALRRRSQTASEIEK
jgi:VWFA-related protein